MHDPLIGRQLANFRVDRLIGRGGMASVYYAWDIKLNRPVAVKVIDTRLRGNPAYAARFLQEARSIAALRHENILQVFYAGEEDDLLYFAMEYIDGQDLGQILKEVSAAGNRLPYEEVIRYGKAAASALDHAHQKGVIHRDVKPANVLISRDGRIVLGDFGLALDVSQGSLGEVFGTATYTAPEQARRSSAAVPQSDLYSLGVMLYEMLTGTVPFDDSSPASVAIQHLTLPPPRPRNLNPDLSQAAEDVLLKALSKDPADRYQIGAEFVAALEEALLQIPGTTSETKAPTPRKLSPLLLASGIGGVLMLCAILAVITALAARKPLPTETLSSTPQKENLVALQPSPSPDEPLLTSTTFMPAAPTGISPTVPPTASSTETPTASPTASPAASPTVSQSPAPTTSVPIDVVGEVPPTSTQKYLTGRRFLLLYNDTSFYMLQTDGYGGLIAPAAFERLDGEGYPVNRFDGDAWAEYYKTTLKNWCSRLEILDAGDYLQPGQCGDNYISSRWLKADDPGIFWTTQENSSQFRVLWGREEVARCEIATGECEVYLP